MKMKKKMVSINSPQTAQEIQDEIFRKMSADRKVLLGSQFWRLGKELANKKISYGTNRSKTTSGRNRKNP